MSFGSNSKNNQDEIVSDINMTPLIDIMLVLLIIFMVTSSVSFDSGLDIDLPKAKGVSQNDQEGGAVIISLDQKGQLTVQGKKVADDQLLEAIKAAIQEEKSSFVILEGDTYATLGKTVEIMDVAKLAGAEKFAIAADKK